MQKTLIFLTIIFFLTVVNSQAFFGKLKVVCIDSAGEIGGIEVIEKSDYIKFNSGTLPITQNNKEVLIAQKTYEDGTFYYINIRKKSLLFIYKATFPGNFSHRANGRCERI